MAESTGIIAGVRPTRMELLTLKERRELAARGYELLREKQDALVREFFSILSETKKFREEMETTVNEAFTALVEAKLSMEMVSELKRKFENSDSQTQKWMIQLFHEWQESGDKYQKYDSRLLLNELEK